MAYPGLSSGGVDFPLYQLPGAPSLAQVSTLSLHFPKATPVGAY
jgi:hypothetical protein